MWWSFHPRGDEVLHKLVDVERWWLSLLLVWLSAEGYARPLTIRVRPGTKRVPEEKEDIVEIRTKSDAVARTPNPERHVHNGEASDGAPGVGPDNAAT